MNIIGQRQHPEKFVPMCIRRIINEEEIQIHANKECTQSGSRFYIHAKDVANALLFIINNKPSCPVDYGGAKTPKFNIVGSQELTNLELAQFISEIIDMPLKYKLVDFHSSRPGHDLRYALDGNLLKSYGWEPKNLEERLVETVRWYLQNPLWL
jgi:dTDP-glucose 4,6-dehydratase